jgi:hypothetical protein
VTNSEPSTTEGGSACLQLPNLRPSRGAKLPFGSTAEKIVKGKWGIARLPTFCYRYQRSSDRAYPICDSRSPLILLYQSVNVSKSTDRRLVDLQARPSIMRDLKKTAPVRDPAFSRIRRQIGGDIRGNAEVLRR